MRKLSLFLLFLFMSSNAFCFSISGGGISSQWTDIGKDISYTQGTVTTTTLNTTIMVLNGVTISVQPTGNVIYIGPTGNAGPTGSQGIQGPTGNNGANGVQGPTGNTGPTGSFVTDASYVTNNYTGNVTLNTLSVNKINNVTFDVAEKTPWAPVLYADYNQSINSKFNFTNGYYIRNRITGETKFHAEFIGTSGNAVSISDGQYIYLVLPLPPRVKECHGTWQSTSSDNTNGVINGGYLFFHYGTDDWILFQSGSLNAILTTGTTTGLLNLNGGTGNLIFGTDGTYYTNPD